MAHPNDYFPVTVKPKVVELRIHGVAGTPPEGLLKKPPVLVAGDEKSGFYRADPHATLGPDKPGIVEAYSWGALTAGTRLSAALRILLLPFSVVNVAGWMVPGTWDTAADRIGDGPTRPEGNDVPGRVRFQVLASRLLALVLTLYAVLGTYWLTLKVMSVVTWDVVDRLPLVRDLNWDGSLGAWLRGMPAPSIRVLVAFSLTMAMVLIWAAVSRRRAVPGESKPDAAALPLIATAPVVAVGTPGGGSQTSFDIASLWTASAITKTLARSHVIAAVTLLTVLHASIAAPDVAGSSWWYLALLFPVVVIGAMSWPRTASRLFTKRSLGLLTMAAVVAVLGAIVATAILNHQHPAPTISTDSFVTTTQHFAFIIAVITVLLLARIALATKGAPFWSRLYSAAFTIVGFGTAIIGYVGGAVVLIALIAQPSPDLNSYTIAVALAVLGLGSVLVVVTCVVLSWNPLNGGGGVDWALRLRATTARARGFIVAGAAFYSLSLVAIFGIWVGVNWSVLSAPNEQLEGLLDPVDQGGNGTHWAALGWILVSLLAGAFAAAPLMAAGRPFGAAINPILPTDSPPDPPVVSPESTRSQSARAACLTLILGGAFFVAGLSISAAVGTWAAGGTTTFRENWASTIAGLDDSFAKVALVCAMIAPVAGIIWYMTSLSAKANGRRIVGVMWDLANFWPRHFHPWAPQPYADRTVPDVARRVEVLRANESVDRVVVSAHSQGANTALPVILKLSEDNDGVDDGKVSLMTYGVLINSHYRWLFPWIFNPKLTDDLNTRLGNRWRNLYRTTDPLGHPIPDAGKRSKVQQRIGGAGLTLPIGLGDDVLVTMLHSDYQYAAEYREALDELGPTPPQ